jgi:hypothetical protein
MWWSPGFGTTASVCRASCRRPTAASGLRCPGFIRIRLSRRRFTEPRLLLAYMAYLELVAEPDDWRVHRIGDPPGRLTTSEWRPDKALRDGLAPGFEPPPTTS